MENKKQLNKIHFTGKQLFIDSVEILHVQDLKMNISPKQNGKEVEIELKFICAAEGLSFDPK